MLLQELILKNYWSFLRFVNLEDIGGYFTRNGEDALILSVLFSHFLKNEDAKIIEINKPEAYPYSLVTAFIATGSCSGVLINTCNRHVLSYAKVPKELPDLTTINESKYHEMFGCLNAYKDTSLLYEYSSAECLLKSLENNQSTYSLVILTIEADSIQILDRLMSESAVFSILILNNTSGFFSCGDMMIREKFARYGFVFHTRLNARHDFFVLSELINGFPSKLFGLMNTVSLQRWVSSPPGSDYSTPR